MIWGAPTMISPPLPRSEFQAWERSRRRYEKIPVLESDDEFMRSVWLPSAGVGWPVIRSYSTWMGKYRFLSSSALILLPYTTAAKNSL